MSSVIYTVIVLVLHVVTDTQEPPTPDKGDGTGGIESPQLPIDDHLWILLVIGLLFGIYIIYKRNRAIDKAS